MTNLFIRMKKESINELERIAKLLRFTYICECGVIYCDNCARALTNLENLCWACDAPIDYSKPFKPKEEETEEIRVDKKPKKVKF